MKGLVAGLVFVCAATVCGLLVGLVGGGLQPIGAAFSLIVGALFAFAAYLSTDDSVASPASGDLSRPHRDRHLAVWLLGAAFALFAFRSFCWLYYIDGADWKIQSPNNLGDLALHLTYIKTFINGVPLWPDNPIYVASKLRYPAGVDLFNALLCLLHLDVAQSLVWLGLLGSLATFYALWRWGRAFGVAGFLFNGGTAGFACLFLLFSQHSLQFEDYQGRNDIAWKSIPLTMFVTQRGWLYAIPVGLLLLWNWRESFFRGDPASERAIGGSEPAPSRTRTGRLSFAAELALYASMPLFHVHTFLALSAVLVFLFVGGDPRIRRHIALLVGSALIPATLFVWLVSDNFQAHSMIKWHPGWVRTDPAMARSNWFDFWFTNFGISLPLVGVLIGVVAWRSWQAKEPIKRELVGFVGLMIAALAIWRVWEGGHSFAIVYFLCSLALLAWYALRALETNYFSHERVSEDIAFIVPAIAIFVTGMLFKFAPWEWDNLKLMVWGYFLVLPFLWDRVVSKWSLPVRAGVCTALFGSGLISLLGGLAAGRDGFGLINRAEVDGVGVGVSILPLQARFASYPTYNHPLLLQGRKVVMGYPGHLWTQGFDDYGKVEAALRKVMNGSDGWRETAHALGARYLFWGPEEKMNYPNSTRPWESVSQIVSSGEWGTIYDLEALEPNAPRSLGDKSLPP